MPDTDGDRLALRAKFFRIGCLVNLVVLAALVTVLVVVLPTVSRTLGFSTPAADEAAVRAVLDAQVAAWNAGDLDGFMAGYWRDEELTFTSGDQVTKGWAATRERYRRKYFTPNAEGKLADRGELAFGEIQVESFSPAAALLRGRYFLKPAATTATGRFTLTFRKFPDGWKITSDHTSVDCPPAKKQ